MGGAVNPEGIRPARRTDPDLAKLSRAVLTAASSAEDAKRTGQETAAAVATLVGHMESVGVQLAAIVREQVSMNQRLESIDHRTTSLDNRVGIQNGRVGTGEGRLLELERWRAAIEAEAAFKRGVLVLPVGAVKIVAKRPQVVAGLLTLILGVLTGANIGAAIALVASWLGLGS